MLTIAICCGGGLSSSALANHLEQEVHRLHLENDVKFVFQPFRFIRKVEDECDIAMLCPHLEWGAAETAKWFSKPMYIIPPRLYGLMDVTSFVEDAQDIIEMSKETGLGKVLHFPGEERTIRISRITSHRRWLEKKQSEKDSEN